METPKARSRSSEAPKKVSSRVARQLKVNPVGFGSSSPASPSTNATRTPKDRSPKVAERRSPRSPVIPEKKRPGRATEFETQISELQDDLKKVKGRLTASKTSKEEAEANAEELKQQLEAVSTKLEESQTQLTELRASKEADVAELKGISEEKDQAWETQLDIIRKQQSIDASALASALDEIQTLKQQLEMVTRCQDADSRFEESTNIELQSLKVNLSETLLVLENMKNEIKSCKESEAQAQGLVQETLTQLEEAKHTVNALRNDGMKAMEKYNSVASELEDSRARVTLLEGLVHKLKAHLAETNKNASEIVPADHQDELDELMNLRSEVGKLKSTLETAEFRHRDEQAQSSAQIKSAHELADQITSQSTTKLAELEAKLMQAKSAIEELKANLMDKETELQGISEENECLNLKLRKSMPDHQDNKLEDDFKRLGQEVANLKESLMVKDTELQNIKEENKMLKAELQNRKEAREEGPRSNCMSGPPVEEAGATREVEQDTQVKLEVVIEEAEKSKRRAERAGELLEAAQAVNAELEAELRRLRVQSDQWRKAAEAAASMLSSPVGNGRFVQRTGSLDNNNGYIPVTGRATSPYLDDYDDDDEAFKKKNGNVLGKIGGFWKKPQK